MTYKITRRDIQNQFIKHYVAPIINNLDFKKVLDNVLNYKNVDREDLREEMGWVGVFDSLEKLESRVTSGDQVFADLKSRIKEKPQEQNLFTYQKPIRANQALLRKMARNMYDLENKITGLESAYEAQHDLLKKNRDKNNKRLLDEYNPSGVSQSSSSAA